MPPSAPAASVVSRRSRLALLAAATAVALLLAEGVLRAWFPEVGKLRQLVVSTDDERGFEVRPGIEIPFAGVFTPLSRTVVWQTNRQGLRDDRAVGPPSRRFRVATYGDSETFGWAVALEDTFQRQMEGLDPAVEVLNFGVPGYNVTNVRDQLERTVPRFEPDLAIYLVNKNDFNEPVTFSPLSYSHVLLHLRFLWHFTVAKKLRLLQRGEEERLAVFSEEVDRMTRFLARRGTPFVVGFLRWRNYWALRDREALEDAHRRTVVNLRPAVRSQPREDGHYAAAAHRRMAALFCGEIAGAGSGGCVPAGWLRPALAVREGSGLSPPLR
jgi:hypothetical protein